MSLPRVAQWLERYPYKVDADGSNPSTRIEIYNEFVKI